MQALVHFTVGVAGALAVLTVVDRAPREEFLLLFLSGFWALLPDGHWLFREFGVDGVAAAWKAFHRSALADLFWFHRVIDSLETGRKNLEAGVALVGLLVVVVGYYWFNAWGVE